MEPVTIRIGGKTEFQQADELIRQTQEAEQTQEAASSGFPKLNVTLKTGGEAFHKDGQSLDLKLIDFWRWSTSDLVSNATRGILAEYIVACALGVADGVRAEWDSYDLLTPSKVRIEVKSAAYLQSWFHKKLSSIIFSIRPTRSWDANTNDMENDLRRQGQIYVFCVLSHKDKATVDPLNLEQWEFYLLSADILNEKFPTQKTISLSSLLKLNPCRAKFDEIAACIHKLAP